MVLPLIDLLFDKYSNKKKPRKEQKSTLKEEKDLITVSSKKYFIPTQYIAPEVNLLKLPFFLLSRKSLEKTNKVEYKTVLQRNGEKLEVFWQVTANSEFGYPGPFDKKVKTTFDQIISERGFPVKNPVPFTFYDICKRLKISPSGTNKRHIKKAIVRIIPTTVNSKGIFYLEEEQKYVDDYFHLYDRVVFAGEKLEDGTVADKNFLFLGDWYIKSLNAFFVKPIDFNYILNLNSSVGSRLYEYLGVKFFGIFRHGQDCYSENYQKICQILPLTTKEHLSSAKQVLEPIHQELIDKSFLSKVEWNGWQINYYPGGKARRDYRENL